MTKEERSYRMAEVVNHIRAMDNDSALTWAGMFETIADEWEQGNTPDTLYAFKYTYCIHESAYQTVSVHRTIKGAQLAMEEHIQKAMAEFKEIYGDPDDLVFGEGESWMVEEIKLLP